MATHDFVFNPGIWIGQGKLTFSASPERVLFYTKWTIKEGNEGKTLCQQCVEMEGGGSTVYNNFTFSKKQEDAFQVELTNEILGSVQGKGVVDANTIAWEFCGHPDFEGFEVYELQENGDYLLHAEYTSMDQMRTIIDGRIWRKEKSPTGD